eukprot:CAMPEP_0184688082 /NCGR_PEP_ID=MMETSP0312-20130426/28511_1 /TAXON_ID=31354 /ORGANISM="Compsopogon coeruleus, Strain SAG 36.94" /LENGTH=86 /DNA_ID=CAMNT_0027144845 /DNA_START=57 /DNA_END=314 /DNA_ORIENTATION=+
MYNGVAMRMSDSSANTYQTTKWQLNELSGGMMFGEGSKRSGKLIVNMSPAQMKTANLNTMKQVVINNAQGRDGRAFVVAKRAENGG